MRNERNRETKNADQRRRPRAGMPGDGAGRIEQAGGAEAGGVHPASGPHPPRGDAPARPPALWGQGEQGAEGYEDHGESEAQTIPVETDEEQQQEEA